MRIFRAAPIKEVLLNVDSQTIQKLSRVGITTIADFCQFVDSGHPLSEIVGDVHAIKIISAVSVWMKENDYENSKNRN